jgi:hypothetical protein
LLTGVEQSIYEGSLLGKILGFTTLIINPDRLLGQVSGRESLFEDSPFDEHTRLILSKTTIPVGIFMNKNLQQINNIFFVALSDKDVWMAPYVEQLVNNTNAALTVADTRNTLVKKPVTVAAGFEAERSNNPIRFIKQETITKELLQQQDLIVISVKSWKRLIESKNDWLADIPSVLILAKK